MRTIPKNLWRKIKEGDLKAFEFLYHSYFPPLCMYAFGFIPDEEFVKEIVNDVFLKIWNKRREIDIIYGIKSYLYRCVHNQCIDHLAIKKEFVQHKKVSISDKIIELTGQDEEYILMQISMKNLEIDVMKSIDQLPPRCKEIFMLSRFELLSYTEISEKLNISVNTVKTQMSRALDSLRVKLQKHL
jgi:RNA polymerase sigma-70 factor (family 1)